MKFTDTVPIRSKLAVKWSPLEAGTAATGVPDIIIDPALRLISNSDNLLANPATA